MESFRKEGDGTATSRRPIAGRLADWAKFGLGLLAILLLAEVLSRGLTPPGPAGEVLRNNQRLDVDATPLFYTEVENFTELERGFPVTAEE